MKHKRMFQRTNRLFYNWQQHLSKAKPYILLSVPIWIGIGLGMMFYAIHPNQTFTYPSAIPYIKDFVSGCMMVVEIGFNQYILLSLLFFFGMSTFGIPLTLLVLLIFGFQLSIEQCTYIANNYNLLLLISRITYLTLSFIGFLVAGKHAVIMSHSLAMQLLPNGAVCGGLWIRFRKFLLSSLLCILLITAACVIECILHLVIL